MPNSNTLSHEPAGAALASLEQLCQERGVKLSVHCRSVLEVIAGAVDYPSAYEISRRAARCHRIGIATVYRVLNNLTAAGIVVRHAFGGRQYRYERANRASHPHLVDIERKRIVEVEESALVMLLKEEARRLGYRLVDYRLRIFAVPTDGNSRDRQQPAKRRLWKVERAVRQDDFEASICELESDYGFCQSNEKEPQFRSRPRGW